MTHYVDAGIDNGPDFRCDSNASLQFDAIAVSLFQESAGVFNRLVRGALIAHKRHISHYESVGSTASNRLGMIDHLIHVDRYRAVKAVNAHTQGVAHQKHIQSGGLCKLCGRKIIGSEICDQFFFLFHLVKNRESSSFSCSLFFSWFFYTLFHSQCTIYF